MVDGTGFEPVNPSGNRFTVCLLYPSCIPIHMVCPEGLEPSARGLKIRCSSPSELRARMVAGSRGFEPLNCTSTVTGLAIRRNQPLCQLPILLRLYSQNRIYIVYFSVFVKKNIIKTKKIRFPRIFSFGWHGGTRTRVTRLTAGHSTD